MDKKLKDSIEDLLKEINKDNEECGMCILDEIPTIIIEQPIINIYIGSDKNV